jgi:ribose transport system substrate-binding protein
MRIFCNTNAQFRLDLVRFGLGAFLLVVYPFLSGCNQHRQTKIAVIPRTCGSMIWEPEHRGAEAVAFELGADIYWNAPTREDDIQGQIAMVERVVASNYQGLVLAPDHALALITPVRNAVARGLPTVIVGSPLAIPPGDGLSYILNDDEAGGRIAAKRVEALLHGSGSVAILGINPDIIGVMTRARSLERELAKNSPNIHVVVEQMGSFNVPHEQQVAEETLKAHPGLEVIVALTSTSAHGAIEAISSASRRGAVKVIVFDPDFLRFDDPSFDSVIVEDTQNMGRKAIRLIVGKIHGEPMPLITRLQPTLVTRANVNTDEIRELTSMDWRPGRLHWRWRVTP